MTTGKIIMFNIVVEGNFDDCQNLVKAMFADNVFNDIKMLVSIQLTGQELLPNGILFLLLL